MSFVGGTRVEERVPHSVKERNRSRNQGEGYGTGDVCDPGKDGTPETYTTKKADLVEGEEVTR